MIISQTFELLGSVSRPSVARLLPKHRTTHKHKINIYTYQTSMPSVGFEPTILGSERAKTVHALDLSADLQPPAHSGSSFADFFYPEDEGDTFLKNVG
jgi:hypothetical protein